MAWVVFLPAVFTAWHDSVCAARGIPKPGRRQSDQTVQVDNEWTTAWVQPTYKATINNKTYYAVNIPDGEPIPPTAAVLTSLTVDQTTGAITVVYNTKTYTATPSGVTASKPKPTTITIDGTTYTRSR